MVQLGVIFRPGGQMHMRFLPSVVDEKQENQV